MSTATLLPPGAQKPKAKAKERSESMTIPASVPIVAPPKGSDFYGGKPAYVGVDVWYCRLDASTEQLGVLPGKLFARGYVNPDLWTVSVTWAAGLIPDGMPDVGFSEEPKHGHWTWPVIPQKPVVSLPGPIVDGTVITE